MTVPVLAALALSVGLSFDAAQAQAIAVSPTTPAPDPRTAEAQQRAMMAHKRAGQIASNEATERKLLAAHATHPAPAVHHAHRHVGSLADRSSDGRRAGVHPAPKQAEHAQTPHGQAPHDG